MTGNNLKTFRYVAVIMSFFFTSCEGFKILTLYNETGNEITIETMPEIPRFKHTSLSNINYKLSKSMVYHIPADSSISLLTNFTGLLFNRQIKENDIPIDYLRIETATDTIIANNRSEIINLLNNPKFRYTKEDKNRALGGSANIGAIIIRQ